jgi:hypothetical protein
MVLRMRQIVAPGIIWSGTVRAKPGFSLSAYFSEDIVILWKDQTNWQLYPVLIITFCQHPKKYNAEGYLARKESILLGLVFDSEIFLGLQQF